MTEEIRNLLRNAPSVAERKKHAAAAAAQKIADDSIKVQFPLTPIYFLAHVINCSITYLFIFKFSGSQRCGEMQKGSEITTV